MKDQVLEIFRVLTHVAKSIIHGVVCYSHAGMETMLDMGRQGLTRGQ